MRPTAISVPATASLWPSAPPAREPPTLSPASTPPSIDSIPFLAITGQANSTQLTQEPFQCVDIAKISEPVTKKSYCVTDAKKLPEILKEAFYLMRSGRPGPVLIDLPLDVQTAEIDFDIDSYTPPRSPVRRPRRRRSSGRWICSTRPRRRSS